MRRVVFTGLEPNLLTNEIVSGSQMRDYESGEAGDIHYEKVDYLTPFLDKIPLEWFDRYFAERNTQAVDDPFNSNYAQEYLDIKEQLSEQAEYPLTKSDKIFVTYPFPMEGKTGFMVYHRHGSLKVTTDRQENVTTFEDLYIDNHCEFTHDTICERLVKTAVKACKRYGMTNVLLRVKEQQVPMLEKLGFVRTGREWINPFKEYNSVTVEMKSKFDNQK